ncbi:MAG TPA: hypothetical protein VH000_10750, partial [Rhizomicrobium sp.]|nr:hypothetical protein [Rhizomicrobium sp.]
LNDTVASLLAGAYLAQQFTHHIGLIVGTGNNMAGFFRVKDIPKLASDARRPGDVEMAVNLESGNFDPGALLTGWDDAVDAVSPPEQRGRQRFEKAVSGAYLPWLLWFAAGEDACRAAHFDPRDPQTNAGTVADARGDPRIGAAATAIIDRSADFTAAALAALIGLYARGKTDVRAGVLAEGTLFWKTPGYAARVMETLGPLLPGTAKAELIDKPASGTATQAIDPNLIGAAAAALSTRR